MVKNVLLCGIVVFVFVFIFSDQQVPFEPQTSHNIPYSKEKFDSFVVLELFTSQGCSSCPAADALLEKVKDGEGSNIFALSYHVDYWNYIGWKDPFSKSEYASKQREYNNKFRNRSNYTPQLVVNGKEHFVGSNARKLSASIGKYLSVSAQNDILLNDVTRSGDDISFGFNVLGAYKQRDLTVRSILVLENRVTKVQKGENRNRTLSNSNIVIAEAQNRVDKPYKTATLKVPEIVRKDERLRLILVLENEEFDILGAAGSEFLKF